MVDEKLGRGGFWEGIEHRTERREKTNREGQGNTVIQQ